MLVGPAPGIAVAYPLTSTNNGAGVDPVLDIPWVVLAAVGIAVPLVAVARTGLFVRSRLPMSRRMTRPGHDRRPDPAAGPPGRESGGAVLRAVRTARWGRLPRLLTALAVVLLVAAGSVAASELLQPRSFAGAVPVSGTEAPVATSSAPPAPVPSEPPATAASPPPAFDRGLRSIDAPNSTWVVVNKLRPLQPPGYEPPDLVDVGGGRQLRAEAAQAIAALRAEAAAAGLDVAVQSAYRSFEYQQALFGDATARFGVAGAELRSARPGYSEHQTGLAVDVGGGGCDIERCFGDTVEGRWVLANAHRTGFLIRYPAGSEPITGYQYEPWHLRYVGPELATEMHETGAATLEEFFGLPPAPTYAAG